MTVNAFGTESALSLPVARQRLLEGVAPVTEIEEVALRDALCRVLATDVVTPQDIPAHDLAAMDGYALNTADLAREDTPVDLRVIGAARAGHPFRGSIVSGMAVDITTGALMPEGADTVVVLEAVERVGDRITLPGRARSGANVRRRGEEIAAGAAVLTAGSRLRPSELGMLAALGHARVPVYRRLKVAVFSTGDELREPGEPLATGQIHDSNRSVIIGALQLLGAEVLDLGVIADRRDAIERTVLEASRQADALISSGGVSVGAADLTAEAIARLGAIDFWRVAMRPGRPLAFGRIGNAPFFGLPGSPAAAIVAFRVLVREALIRMSGAADVSSPALSARCTRAIAKQPGRSEYPRGWLSTASDGTTEVTPLENQSAGALSPLRAAHCLIALPHDRGSVEAGDRVDCLPLDGTF